MIMIKVVVLVFGNSKRLELFPKSFWLVTDKEWERAALLAEKYLDFESLVLICESTNNQRRLDEYMDRFGAEGFTEYVYNWYLQHNKSAKLIDRCRTGAAKSQQGAQKLTSFLSDRPKLSWLQNVFEGNFASAADILNGLGQVRRLLPFLTVDKQFSCGGQDVHSFCLSLLEFFSREKSFVGRINSCMAFLLGRRRRSW